MTEEQQKSLREAAIEYAERGWKVFPLKPASKEPNNQHGFKDALTDPELVGRYWADNPDDNIGIATSDSDLYVLDIDGPEGQASLEKLEARFGKLPETLTALTGKGQHYFFRYSGDKELGNSAGKEGKRLGKGIDTRGTGGYVVAPPSIHPDGRTYRWMNPDTEMAWLPEWVVAKLKEEVSWKRTKPSEGSQVQKTWERMCLRLAQAEEGSRNEALNEAAFTMGGWIASNEISREEVERTLWIISTQIGLEESEIQKTMESGIDSGMLEPIYPTDKVALPYESREMHQKRIDKGRINIRRGSTFSRRKVSFFWNNRIPLGKLTIIAGQGGIGKSFLTLSLASHITAGAVLLDTHGQTLDGEVLFCSYEDDVEDTIGPRADRIGVDLDRCHFITGVDTEHGNRDFGPQDVEMITDFLRSTPDVKMVAIDPLGSFMGGASDMNAENQTRAVLKTLTDAAQKTNTAIVVVAHLRKAIADDDPIHRISGSVGITNISRSVLLVERDKEDQRKRWVRQLKHNYSKPAPDIAYTFEDDLFRWIEVKHSAQECQDWVRITLGMNDNKLPIDALYERGRMHNFTSEEIAEGFKRLEAKDMVRTVPGPKGYNWELIENA